ncbi:hypothetical protein N7468_010789 [Penicillium chermesinum]|uniref:Pirin N-terminal domain-containing protein n=1 Tax=Penicillium chermesinum TaxID=63820 RepID=A0A9W9N8A9_9EURO|nr:uncharacterized protein N7468_010789 [Penicillium chermesinum]KAJ5215110.1 hypothetical protein N7468_010789 [Penicillium chermesinum]
MTSTLAHAKIVLRRSSERGYAEHGGWLKTFHTFSFAGYWDHRFMSFGSLRVLNEDRVSARNGFPTHPHRDAEIFSYILSGELTHRDSMIKKGAEGAQGKQFYRMHRGDVQFTTGGTGEPFLSLIGRNRVLKMISQVSHTRSRTKWPEAAVSHQEFCREEKRKAFVPILSPLAAGPEATPAEEDAAVPKIPDTIPIHADFVMGAGIIAPNETFKWNVGAGDVVESKKKRNVYIHLPMTKQGKSKVKLNGREEAVLEEGDGAFVTLVNAGDLLQVESVGEAEAEVIVLDSN